MTTNPKPLTPELVNEIGNAYKRLLELSANKIITPSQDAEKAALQKYLATEVPKHLGELLGCWIAVRQEYEPLVNVVASFLNRVAVTTEMRRQPQPEAVQAAAWGGSQEK